MKLRNDKFLVYGHRVVVRCIVESLLTGGGGLAPCGWSRQGQEEGSCVYELVQDEWSKYGKNRNYTPLSGDILCIFARVFYAPPCQPMNER